MANEKNNSTHHSDWDLVNSRKEYRRMLNNESLSEKLGNECACCGSDKGIEYHHIVPLSLGGTNRLTNIVPLCHACHKAAHCGQHMSHYSSHSNSGRKPKVPDEEAFKAYDLWLDGQIGNKKCGEMLSLKGSTKPNHTQQYKRYMDARGITSIRNIFDVGMTLTPQNMREGKVVGKIVYSDGREEDIRFKDTGLMDDVVYDFCDANDRTKKATMTWAEMKAKMDLNATHMPILKANIEKMKTTEPKKEKSFVDVAVIERPKPVPTRKERERWWAEYKRTRLA